MLCSVPWCHPGCGWSEGWEEELGHCVYSGITALSTSGQKCSSVRRVKKHKRKVCWG